jgi:hypothetical protein
MEEKKHIRGSFRKNLYTLALITALAVAVMAGFLAGCSKDLGRPRSNSSPETGVFVEGPLDTVNYAVKMYWWGQDVDGEVVGFYYRWTCDDPAVPVDTNWVFTTATNQDFILPVPDGFALQTFWVKAVDNANEEDPTPAIQDFPLRNQMPSVTLNAALLPTSTLPAVTFFWTGTDPDGDNTIVYYVVWLDGKEDSPLVVAGTDTTIGPDYLDSYGSRTFYVRPVDESQGSCPPASHTWTVLEPVGEVLLVDDVPATVAGASITDAFYRSLLDSLVGAGAYTVFDVAAQGTFRSPAEVGLILPLFQQVVWYGDTRATPSAALSMGQSGIGQFLDGGGSLYVEGVATLGDNGSLPISFARAYFGIDSLRTRYISPSVPSSTNFDLYTGMLIRGNHDEGLDSLVVGAILSGCEVPFPSPAGTTLLYLPPGTISGQTVDYCLGTLIRGPTHKAVCLTFPVRRCNASTYVTARREVAKLLTILGVGQ